MAAPFIAAIFGPLAVKLFRHHAGWVLALVPAAIFYQLATQIPLVVAEESIQGGFIWVPTYGLNFTYLIDGLSLTFGMLISGIGTLIVIYTGGYLKGHAEQGRFFSFLFMFMGAMLGLVLSNNLITLFVYWELTSITSFLLIGFDHKREAARRAAVQALVVTGGGGLALLAGFLLIMLLTGQTEMTGVLLTGGFLREHPAYIAVLLLVLGGAFTKSAQFPLHFWLPNAMEAPTPVSAYLHSATMVKAGVYLLMRMQPVLGDTVAWSTILPIFGGVTLLVGTVLGVRQTDLKLKLAYTTVASLGLLVMLVGTSNVKAIEGAVLYLIAHSLFKGALFMVAGTVDHEAGTRDMTRLGGLRKAMPITAAAALLAALSMGGIWPLLGFVAKEVLYEGIFDWQIQFLLLTIVAVLGNAMMLAVGFAVALRPFWGPAVDTPKAAHEAPMSLWLGPVVLSVLGLAATVFGHFTEVTFLKPMALAVTFSPELSAHVALSVHFGPPLILSLITMALGFSLLFFAYDRARLLIAGVLDKIGWGPDKGFDQFIGGTVKLATVLTGWMQNGKLETYLAVVFLAIGATLFIPMIAFGELPSWPAMPDLFFYEWAILLLAVLGVVAVALARSRLMGVVSLGIQGFAVALIYMIYGAPDLSFTQFMVETLSVVILALVLTRMRIMPHDQRPWGQMSFDIGIAAVVGAGFALLLLSVSQFPFDSRLSDFFTANSRIIAHGRNIVNVIIVDFRGLDTLGEISVVMIAGLAILALIRIKARPDQPSQSTGAKN
jgi:multicomponent Na+:H+ antiporter subunit A